MSFVRGSGLFCIGPHIGRIAVVYIRQIRTVVTGPYITSKGLVLKHKPNKN